MKKNILALAVLSSLSTGAFAQDPRNNDIKVTADIHAGCDLTADNINFGVLMMPLSDSTAQANMNVKCSKGANLQLAIAYNSQGQVSSGGNYTVQYANSDSYYEQVKVYKDGNGISKSSADITCQSSEPNKVYIYTTEFQTLLNASSTMRWIQDEWGICSGSRANYDNIITAIGGISRGALSGLSSSETINYFLTVPNTNSAWGGNTQYELLATGIEQTIPMKANIKRSDNATHRLTPDTYQSTLTVVLTY